MALSRIWAAFIIVAVTVAAIRILTSDNKVIFTSMVTGKSGDTIKLNRTDTTTLNAVQLRQLDSSGAVTPGNRLARRTADGSVQYYAVQNADGIIETTKSAVNIS
ncbi:MAG: spore maturation protein, partial [Bacteroidota bacterium]|nr:spore maturation protein [Bacteroidota bacterium]